MKELPATLLMRPFNFETLATHVYSYAGLEQFETATPGALTIVLVGLIPVLLLHQAVAGGRAGGEPTADESPRCLLCPTRCPYARRPQEQTAAKQDHGGRSPERPVSPARPYAAAHLPPGPGRPSKFSS